MRPPVPLQFLVGLTRLIAIYFGLRSLEGTATAFLQYSMQRVMTPEFAKQMPGVAALYIPTVAFYLALVVAVWFLAPSICRLPRKASPDPAEKTEDVCWNEVMIFLTGVLLVGWGLSQLAATLSPILQAPARGIPRPLSPVDQLSFFVTALLLGFGAVMMSRFPSIYRWMQRRRAQGAELGD